MKKVILVTGASGDISQELLPILIQKGFYIVGLDKKKSLYENPYFEFFSCDLSSEQQVMNIIANGSETWLKNLVGIVHLAGVYPNKNLMQYTTELWDYVFSVNTKSIFTIMQSIMQSNVHQLTSIVLTSSTATKVGSNDPAYLASKSALNGLAKNLSLTLSPYNIRVNTVLPGIIETSMSSESQSAQRRNYHIQNTLKKKIGTPKEVAVVIAFLLSEETSYIWGASIDINGGMTL